MNTYARRERNKILGVAGCIMTPFLFLAIGGLLVIVRAHPLGTAFLVLLSVSLAAAVGHRRSRKAAELAAIHAAQAAEIARVHAAQSMEIDRYYAMDPRGFEHAIAYLCQRDGCHQVQVVGGAGDLGADVIAVAPDGRRIVIQCKRYGPTTKVSSPDLQRFGGTCYSVHGAQVAAVVTTSVFTLPAFDYGTRHGIRLFDQGALAGWATRTGPAPWM